MDKKIKNKSKMKKEIEIVKKNKKVLLKYWNDDIKGESYKLFLEFLIFWAEYLSCSAIFYPKSHNMN